MRVHIRTKSGAVYQVDDPSFAPEEDAPIGEGIELVRVAIAEGHSIRVAVNFQGGGTAYVEHVLFTFDSIESIGVRPDRSVV